MLGCGVCQKCKGGGSVLANIGLMIMMYTIMPGLGGGFKALVLRLCLYGDMPKYCHLIIYNHQNLK